MKNNDEMEHKGVKIPKGARAWELYAAKKGATQAAARMTHAAIKAIDRVATSKVEDLKEAIFDAEALLRKEAWDQGDYGARDTEVSSKVEDILRGIRKSFGISTRG
ncbi:MAG: hypothetical protein JRH07_10625 [Deltaproteobacteria bacterium]|nr:hypothetical protein [Deltaproteobacteria bacterium]